MRGWKTSPTRSSTTFAAPSLCLCFLLLLSSTLPAQTLARPRWANSGLSAEPWWRNALFYRIDPATFQDSDGDGKGDLHGIAQRMDYLQTLAVDAIVLEPPLDQTGFDDLISEATRRHIRILITVPASNANTTVSQARTWLARGCAGIWLRVAPKADAPQTVGTVQVLRKLVDSFPGQRVIVEDTSADPAQVPVVGAQLATRMLMPNVGDHINALSLRLQMAQFSSVPSGSSPLLLLRQENPQASEGRSESLAKIFASALLLSRGAALIDAGQEIDRSTAGNAARLMQWTPSNVTRAPAPPEPPPLPPPPQRNENDYGTYVPYVAPKKPVVKAEADLDDLPGFSSTALAIGDPAPKTQNVASEDVDVNSLLNFYRRLSQLHHEDITLRTGGTVLLNRDSADVLAWLRKAPPGARNSFPIFIAANLSDATETISFAPDAPEARPKGTGLHSLAVSSVHNMQYAQKPTAVTMAPVSVVILSASQ